MRQSVIRARACTTETSVRFHSLSEVHGCRVLAGSGSDSSSCADGNAGKFVAQQFALAGVDSGTDCKAGGRRRSDDFWRASGKNPASAETPPAKGSSGSCSATRCDRPQEGPGKREASERPRAAAPHGRSFPDPPEKGRVRESNPASPNRGNSNLIKAAPNLPKAVEG